MAEHLCLLLIDLSLRFLYLEQVDSPRDVLDLFTILNDQQIDSCKSLYKNMEDPNQCRLVKRQQGEPRTPWSLISFRACSNKVVPCSKASRACCKMTGSDLLPVPVTLLISRFA
jgi:hypothetical protein